MIDLYTWPTPNGQKIQIMLEETELAYSVNPVNITEGAQFDADFLAMSPNNKIPAIVDDEGPTIEPYTVFESGAILLYLADKTNKLIPPDTAGRYEAIQWLMFQLSSLGPMLGQAQYFHQHAPDQSASALERYTKEGYRLLDVLERRLDHMEFLAGDYSIADIACFPWVRQHDMAGLHLKNHPRVDEWRGNIEDRPAVERGLAVLEDEYVNFAESETALKNLFGAPQYLRQRS
ncbi:MAG: glutathione S-transferase N-terminal domain-containing protein [Alphaproteobacteria bacterium]|nr:glutathione S-transferase N-terminal domain-containing protein [Alphaproteobacteria bacterium]